MNKLFKAFATFALVFALAPALASCDSDNDDDDVKDPSEIDNVVGTYTGPLTANVAVYNQVWDNLELGECTFKIIKQSNSSDRVTVEIPECSYTPPMGGAGQETIPALTITDVKVESIGNGMYTLDRDEHSITVGNVEYKVEIEDYDKDDAHREDGTTISGQYINLVYSVTPGKMPGAINFTFRGSSK